MSDTLKNAQELIEAQNKELVRIAQSPLSFATIVGFEKEFVFIASRGQILRVAKPKMKLEMGDSVLVYSDTQQIIERAEKNYEMGKIVTVSSVGKEKSEVNIDGSLTFVFNGTVSVKINDRVMLDSSGSVILENLGQTTQRHVPQTVPSITWDDIGGLEEAKASMIETIELPHTNKKLFEKYGKKPSKGVLLYGPPGCGKTLLGKAAANALARIYDAEKASSGFMYIKGPEILDKYVGESEAADRSIFHRAAEHKAKHGYPAVVFIDEADAILSRRGSGKSHMENTIVPMFLVEMDGLEESSAIVILATNRPDSLDPAIVRDGRIDRKINVARPNAQSAAEIIAMNLANVPVSDDKEKIIATAVEEIYDPKRVFYQLETEEEILEFTLASLVNGAMLAGVVDQAVSLAMRRDLIAGKFTGVYAHDIVTAIDNIEKQNRDLSHKNELQEFAENYGKKVINISKAAKRPKEEYAEAA